MLSKLGAVGQENPGCASLSNTHTQSYSVSEDWVGVGLNVSWGYGGKFRFSAVKHLLRGAQSDSQASNSPIDVDVFGLNLRVFPRGVFVGAQRYDFKFDYRGVRFLLARDEGEVPQNGYSCILDASGVNLAGLGGSVEAVREVYRHLISEFDGDIQRERMRRVDPKVDLINGLPVSWFSGRWDAGDFVSVWRQNNCRRVGSLHAEETFYIGKNPAQVRIYDKLKQLVDTLGDVSAAAVGRLLWGGGFRSVTRFEFELYREFLFQKCSIDTVDDYISCRRSLVEKLFCAQLRFLPAGAGAAANPWRVDVAPEWAAIRDAFREWAGDEVGKVSRRVPRGWGCDPQRHLAMAAAHLMSGAIYATEDGVERYSDFVDWMLPRMAALFADGEFERIRDAARKRVFNGGLDAVKRLSGGSLDEVPF